MFDLLGKLRTKTRRIHSFPLIYPEKKLCLFFSAKSGCTFATKWFFYQQGLLDKALAYNKFVHAYRRHIYVKSEDYKNERKLVFSDDYIRIKLVRSPYTRAVSSYIHAVKSNHVDTEISTFLNRPLDKNYRFSFEEFIAFLEETGVIFCNPHNRIQALPEELQNELIFSYIIKLENSMHEFKALETKLNLKNSDLESLSQSFHHRIKLSSNEYNGNKQLGQLDDTFYSYESFYNESLKAKVAKLYSSDFTQYQYKVDEF